MTKPSNLALMLQQMNQEYAVLMLNNKVSILRENGDEKPTFLSKGDFKTLTENKYVSVSKTSRKGEEFMVEEPISKWWLSHPKRKEYSGVEFAPGKKLDNGKYNLFSGWPHQAEGEMENIPFFHELLLDVICAGNEKHADYLVMAAHLVQKLGEPGVAIVLRSNEQELGNQFFLII